jgi:predicted permease
MNAPVYFRSLLQDASYALRSLRRSPGFSLFTALVIGLGIGAATAVFSVVKPLILAPLPFEDPEALVWIANDDEEGDQSLSMVTSRSGNLRDFRERTRSFAGLTGYNAFFGQQAYTFTGIGEPQRLVGAGVAQDFLDVLGVEPVHGRSFSVEEGLWGGPGATILSYGFWRSRFDADPGVVGRGITLNEQAYTVVGVLPPSFDFSSFFAPGVEVDFLLPFPVSAETDNWGNTMVILGRLRPGVTPEAAQAELDGILAGLQDEQPDRWGLGARLTPLQEKIAGPFLPTLLLLGAAAGTLLLIVCVNVSNLLLARSPGRAREVAVRKALGASRGRLVRQLVLEMVGIALVGSAVGGGLGWAATRLIANTTAIRIPLLDQMKMDGSAFLVGAGVALCTGILVSIFPALRVEEGGEASVLKSESRGSLGGRGGRRLRECLVVAQVALVCVLLVVGGLLARSFQAVLGVDLGYDPENAVAWQVNPTRAFRSLGEESEFYAILTDRVAQIPGIEEAGLIDALPLGRNRSWGFQVVGRPDEDDGGLQLFPHIIDPGYLPAMRISIVEGRSLSKDDVEDSPLAILMNESGARQVFRGEEPLGRRIRLYSDNREWEVVGIVGDVRHLSPERGSGIQVYFPLSQMGEFATLDLVVRSHLPVGQVAAAVSPALRELDPSMSTREFWTLEGTVDSAVSARSFTLWILTSYGAAALLLAVLGIYGVIAQSVAERTPEIGIRVALGASGQEVVRSVLGRTVALAAAGGFAGALASIWAARLLGSLLFGVGANDPVTLVGAALVLALAAALAGLIPAVRAARIRGTRALQAQ